MTVSPWRPRRRDLLAGLIDVFCSLARRIKLSHLENRQSGISLAFRMAEKIIYPMPPPFRSMIRADGFAEVWSNNGQDKLKQFGWRCTNNESNYELDTLIGNWSEEKRELVHEMVPEPLPSQHAHYFNSTYNSTYNADPKRRVPEELKHLKHRHPHAFPHHQPELDTPKLKEIYNSWETTMRASYMDPRGRKNPIIPVGKD